MPTKEELEARKLTNEVDLLGEQIRGARRSEFAHPKIWFDFVVTIVAFGGWAIALIGLPGEAEQKREEAKKRSLDIAQLQMQNKELAAKAAAEEAQAKAASAAKLLADQRAQKPESRIEAAETAKSDAEVRRAAAEGELRGTAVALTDFRADKERLLKENDRLDREAKASSTQLQGIRMTRYRDCQVPLPSRRSGQLHNHLT
jgi:hypothetical protein